jgi:hypothetical protein
VNPLLLQQGIASLWRRGFQVRFGDQRDLTVFKRVVFLGQLISSVHVTITVFRRDGTLVYSYCFARQFEMRQ